MFIEFWWFFFLFFSLSKFWFFYLLQAQFHHSWRGSRDSFGISCPHRRALVHIGRSVFILGHQAGLANLLLLLDGYLRHGFTVLFSPWVCLQRSLWIFWSREKNFILGMYCVAVGRNWEEERRLYVQLSDQQIWIPSHFTSGNHLDATQSCFVLN